MSKTVVIIHTSPVSLHELKTLFAEIIPEAAVYNIIDDSLLAEVSRNGAVTPGIVRRMTAYVRETSESLGADLIFNQCSSVSEVMDGLHPPCPILKIDQAMAEEAVRLGRNIAVIATVASTCGPSGRLVESAARAAGKDVRVNTILVDGALAMLMNGDRERHNRLVLDAVAKAEKEADVIVLAQGSMTVLLPELGGCVKPVLTSPRPGVQRARRVLGL